ncbi:MAG: hypothetical protein OK438_05505 [Thaumarchaeota archaeon]|nr:hypothetical protein [Nitrososphaerota archaeon]
MTRHSLGQHYLVDQDLVRKIVSAAAIHKDERVLEIGTGKGALSQALVGLGRSFEGYEVDRENYAETLEALGRKDATIHLGDAFKETPRFDVLISSLPYSKSAAFVEWLSRAEYERAVVLLQEDFVDKVLAEPGARDYRGVSAIAQISSELRVLWRVGRSAFSPPPRVNSVVVSIKPKRRMSRTEVSKVKLLFSLRRREVASALAKLKMAVDTKAFAGRRVYSLRPEEVMVICADRR